MKSPLLSLLALLIPFAFFAQEAAPGVISTATDPDAAYHECINAIYSAEYLENASSLRPALLDLLKNRVSYVEEPVRADDKYPLLSSLPLMNKFNTAIQPHDPALFNVQTFNPLIYSWNFFDNRIQVYRIDGTDYLLVVQPQVHPEQN